MCIVFGAPRRDPARPFHAQTCSRRRKSSLRLPQSCALLRQRRTRFRSKPATSWASVPVCPCDVLRDQSYLIKLSDQLKQKNESERIARTRVTIDELQDGPRNHRPNRLSGQQICNKNSQQSPDDYVRRIVQPQVHAWLTY